MIKLVFHLPYSYQYILEFVFMIAKIIKEKNKTPMKLNKHNAKRYLRKNHVNGKKRN